MKKKYLILGASGFIGKNLTNHFSKFEDIELFGTYYKSNDNYIKNINIINADLTKKTDVEKVVKGMDVIIQAAAITSGAEDVVNNPVSHITDNVIMNSLIFRAAHDY